MLLSVLGSGSKGNCTIIQEGSKAVLIDAGLSYAQTKSRLEERNLDINNVKAIFITHSHIDHIQSAWVIAKKVKCKVYAPEEVIDCIHKRSDFKDVSVIEMYYGITIGNMLFDFFKLSHDTPSYGYLVSYKNSDTYTIGYLTDTGKIPRKDNLVKNAIECCSLVILESNHDEYMLMNGSYPRDVKDRVDSDKGHLSNLQAALFVKSLDPTTKRRFILAHISEENNTHEAIKKTFKETLGKDIDLHIASQDEGSSLILI